MMDALDPRHGTYAGANQHWITKTPICEPCGQAAYRYVKKCRLDKESGAPRSVPVLGTRRRIQALGALGYSYNQIGRAVGVDRSLIMRWATASDRVLVHSATANKIAAAYEQLSMTLPDNSNNRRDYFRLMARRKGWVPPLAWDDIDDPNETPGGRYEPATRAELIQEYVDRGDNLTHACRALRITPNSLNAWCLRTGHTDLYRALARREGDWNSRGRIGREGAA
jgi:hypothetical protein